MIETVVWCFRLTIPTQYISGELFFSWVYQTVIFRLFETMVKLIRLRVNQLVEFMVYKDLLTCKQVLISSIYFVQVLSVFCPHVYLCKPYVLCNKFCVRCRLVWSWFCWAALYLWITSLHQLSCHYLSNTFGGLLYCFELVPEISFCLVLWFCVLCHLFLDCDCWLLRRKLSWRMPNFWKGWRKKTLEYGR